MADRLESDIFHEDFYDGPALDAVIEHRIGEMHEMLNRMAPMSASVALKTLRDAFPEVSLAQRVKALSGRHH
jgi:hypothetical protein